MAIAETILALLMEYGLIGAFFGSFIQSLVFVPGFTEALIPIFVTVGFNPIHVLIVVIVGSILGGIVDYYLGFIGSSFALSKKRERTLKSAKMWLNKWGDMSVVITSFVPGFPFDIIAVLVGFLKMNFKSFLISMAIGKVIKFSLIIFGVEVLLKIFGTV